MRRCVFAAAILSVLLLSDVTLAEDWAHWRGPTYNGVAEKSPALVDSFGQDGPKKLWESEVFYADAKDTGSGSVTVVDGRAYTFVHARYVQSRPWKRMSKDFVFCFDAGTGKTLWKKELPSWHLGWSASCTPTIVDGKCYLLSSEAIVYCLDAKTGDEVWKSEFIGKQGNKHNRSSSVLIVDGVAVVVTVQNAVGLDAKTGKVLWREPKIKTEYGSAVPWKSGGKTYAILMSGRVNCLEPKTGKIVWQVSGGNGPTATIVGKHMAVNRGRGLTLYEMTADAPKKLWDVKFGDAFTSPTICDGHVYIFGGSYGGKKPSRAMCVEIATGKVCWDEKVGSFQFSSGTVADGKIIISGGPLLHMVKPDPAKYTELGRTRIGLRSWASQSLVDGKLYVRTRRSVACYDLRK